MTWTRQRTAALQALAKRGLSHSAIARRMGLPRGAISAKLDRLAKGAIAEPTRSRSWSEAEDARLRELFAEGLNDRAISAAMDRRIGGVINRRHALNLMRAEPRPDRPYKKRSEGPGSPDASDSHTYRPRNDDDRHVALCRAEGGFRHFSEKLVGYERDGRRRLSCCLPLVGLGGIAA